MLRDDIRKTLEKYYDPANDNVIGEGLLSLDQATDSIMKAILADLPVEKEFLFKENEYPLRVSDVLRNKLKLVGFNSCLAEIKKKWRIK